ncbi:hypothetical protein B0J11DRAFT_522746 [Dendryphion nanum]|uniref:Uncharacterized protein n=1 Tax=Dendryphion nanum TaxID=256645 RepID=A0A9P9E5D2_9PLEO|nr:hypothetical protein B0J11DRAFT_522746 [Dendryphion nanum]
MSSEYSSTDPLTLAKQAERDLNSHAAIHGHEGRKGTSDSTTESGINTAATTKFPGSTATYGSAASGAGNNREIPESEGGGVDPQSGKPYKARDFQGGIGGPEDHAARYAQTHGGDDAVRGNVAQKGVDGPTLRQSGVLK